MSLISKPVAKNLTTSQFIFNNSIRKVINKDVLVVVTIRKFIEDRAVTLNS